MPLDEAWESCNDHLHLKPEESRGDLETRAPCAECGEVSRLHPESSTRICEAFNYIKRKDLIVSNPTEDAVRGLKDLDRRPLWCRLWPLGELTCARMPLLQCGAQLVSLDIYVKLVVGQMTALPDVYRSARFTNGLSFAHSMPFMRAHYSACEGRCSPDLLLGSTLYMQTTEPRDKLFALYGILRCLPTVPPPDYTLSPLSAVENFFDGIFQAPECDDMLAWMVIHAPATQEEMGVRGPIPSWIPSFHEKREAYRYSELFENCTANSSRRGHVSISKKGNISSPKDSAKPDGISARRDRFVRGKVKTNEGPAGTSLRHGRSNERPGNSNERSGDSISRRGFSDQAPEQVRVRRVLSVRGEEIARVDRVIGPLESKESALLENYKETGRLFATTTLEGFTNAMMSRLSPMFEDDPAGAKRQFYSIISQCDDPDKKPYGVTCETLWKEIMVAEKKKAPLEEFQPGVGEKGLLYFFEKMFGTLGGQSFIATKRIATKKTDCGLGPAHAKKGDRVCAFYGCRFPILIRESSEHKGEFTMVGPAYIWDLMKGDAVTGKYRTFDLC